MSTAITDAASVDLAVIGSGAAGMAAALTAASSGAKVVVLEKMGSLGGVSHFAEGLFAAESALQRANYVCYSRDEAFRTIMEYSHWRADARLVRAFVNESADSVAWLQQLGVEFEGLACNSPGAPMVWHVLKGNPKSRSSAMMKILFAKARENGVDIQVSTPVKEIIRENGKAAGVIALRAGKEFEIRSKAVMIATGGYANNKEWIRKYAGLDLGTDITPIANVEKMGDGIRMAWQAGGAEEGMGVLQMLKAGPVLGAAISFIGPLESAANQPSLWVNQHAERYCDESIQGNFAFDGNAMARQKGKSVFSLFDDSIIDYWMEKGTDLGIGRIFPPASRLDVRTEIDAALEKKASDIFAADSTEELALQAGLNPAVLKATVEEYNSFCEKGHDGLFAKDPKYLRPLKGPRFYALKCNLVFLGTLGGIKINHKMEVVDAKQNTIPGLYAGGMDAGGLYGDSYDVITCGGTFAFAVGSGRIAGRSALEYLGKQ